MLRYRSEVYRLNGDFAKRLGAGLLDREPDEVITLQFRRRSDGGENLICESILPSGAVRRRVIRERARPVKSAS